MCECYNILYTASAPSDWRIRLNWYCCVGDVDLLNRIETVMEGNKQEGGGVAAMAILFFPAPPLLNKVEQF